MKKQLANFAADLRRMLGKRKARILNIWSSRVFWGILPYRIERGLYEMIGERYELVRAPFVPLLNLAQAYSNIDLHYKSDIGGGLLVLHPAGGVVISGFAVIGEGLTLTGGNIIGARAGTKFGEIVLGDHCELGANAVVIGPVTIGDRVRVGASACVVRDCEESDTMLVGVPAEVYAPH